MSEPAGIPADIIEQLTAIAARMAASSKGERPTEAAVVATTQQKALDLLMHARIPGSEHRQVYAMTMTGHFVANRHGPRGVAPEGSVKTVLLSTDTFRASDTSIGDMDHRALLPQLGPVTILQIPAQPLEEES
jgi:hypothetical protein